MLLIYLDTTIWNVLADQSTDAKAACNSLAQSDAQIVLGLNAYFEMLMSFYGKKPNAKPRGRDLFTCVDRLFTQGVRIIRTWEEMLMQESQNVLGAGTSVDVFCEGGFASQLISAAKDLASGAPHPGTQALISKRDAHSKEVGNLAEQEILNQPDMVSDLRSVAPADLAEFLNSAACGPQGHRLLARYISQIFALFGQELPVAAEELAGRLFISGSNRAAHAIVRSDIYQCWRAARREQVRIHRCVPDDSYHVVNASYCDIFVTEDRDGQADAASNVLVGCKVLLYDNRQTPFFEWLPRRISEPESLRAEEQIKHGRKFMAKYRDTFRALSR